MSMKITLITQEVHDQLQEYYEKYPNLTLQNKGYEGIDFSKLSEEERSVKSEIEGILKKHIDDFIEFQNFVLTKKSKEVQMRFQYIWDPGVTYYKGVGYLLIDELLNGFRWPEPDSENDLKKV